MKHTKKLLSLLLVLCLILSYLLHREYKRTQPLMEVANGHQKRCKHYYF